MNPNISSAAGIENRIGNFYYATGAKLTKEFPGGRHFSVIVAGAYNVGGGIVPERNGVVILDENNRQVVLSSHKQVDSGYHGPAASQMAEAKRIVNLPWAEFTDFIRNHPNYNEASMPDLHHSVPMKFVAQTKWTENSHPVKAKTRTRLSR